MDWWRDTRCSRLAALLILAAAFVGPGAGCRDRGAIRGPPQSTPPVATNAASPARRDSLPTLPAAAPAVPELGALTAAPSTNAPPAANPDALMTAWRQEADPSAMPVENLSLPIDHYPNGRPRAVLKAARALVPPKGFIRAGDVNVEMYDEQGRLEGLFLAENCIYDRLTQCGYCEGTVRIERSGVRITGVNMVWQMRERSAKILSRAEVRVERFVKGFGGLFK